MCWYKNGRNIGRGYTKMKKIKKTGKIAKKKVTTKKLVAKKVSLKGRSAVRKKVSDSGGGKPPKGRK